MLLPNYSSWPSFSENLLPQGCFPAKVGETLTKFSLVLEKSTSVCLLLRVPSISANIVRTANFATGPGEG